MGLIPLFFSIFTFVYDYYSDVELTLEYYHNAFILNHTQGKKRLQEFSGESTEVIRTSEESSISYTKFDNVSSFQW